MEILLWLILLLFWDDGVRQGEYRFLGELTMASSLRSSEVSYDGGDDGPG
jgi:hypothetical protein